MPFEQFRLDTKHLLDKNSLNASFGLGQLNGRNPIKIRIDNGKEFCSGSARKLSRRCGRIHGISLGQSLLKSNEWHDRLKRWQSLPNSSLL